MPLISPSDKEISSLLAPFEHQMEFYQKPEYLQTDAQLLKGEAFYYLHELESGERLLIPIIQREIPVGRKQALYDWMSPYGYPGMLFSSQDMDIQMRLLESMEEDLKKEFPNVVSMFLRLHPYINRLVQNESDKLKRVNHGKVVFVDLRLPYESLKASYSKNHKRDIKSLAKAGFQVKHASIADIDEFIRVYNETMDRLNASPYYYFDHDYYTSLFKENEGKMELILVENAEGKVVSGALFAWNDNILQYHLGGTSNDYVSSAPNKLMFDYIIQTHAGSGKYFNLGGGLGGEEDNLFRFKAGFSKRFIPFFTLRYINRPDLYLDLSSSFSKEEQKDLKGFFPLYRKPE